MTTPEQPKRRRLVLFAPALALAFLLAVRPWWCDRAHGPDPPEDLDGWDIPRLARHLEARGLTFRLVPPACSLRNSLG